ncbi:MAG: hypothetical protein CL666_14240 [Balneola sp.]|nr:hypothetical protein [Balneola sp.]|tara:strand:- start:4342 stop:5667 length:1326 start_codon:yes stop_codon:yes gene_type:complete
MDVVLKVVRIFCGCMILLAAASSQGIAQDTDSVEPSDSLAFKITGDKDERITIPFEVVNNLIIIKATINDSAPLKFILDTGVAKTLVTSLPGGAEILLKSSRVVQLSGLGVGDPVEAFYSEKNSLSIDRVVAEELDILFLKEDIFQLSSFMGTEVHGIMGYELFASFAVEINYISEEIFLYHPEAFEEKFERLPRHRKWHKISLQIHEKKPYVNVSLKHQPGASEVPLRLLIDTGSSNAFSLYDLTHDEIEIPKSRINSLIGVGLSGQVSGYMGRVEAMKLADMKFEEPVIAYPDSVSIRRVFSLGDRNGSLGGEVLRRFKVIFHYPNKALYVRKNRDFGDRFYYNLTGIEVNTPLPNLPLYVVSDVRENSPADQKGIQKGDIIKHINAEPVSRMGLNEVIAYLQKTEGRRLRVGIQRDSVYKRYEFKLRNKLQVDEAADH